ncbi:hypothetical protein HPB48_004270 [Haemaphysalis longicornis]|uniref:Ubiquitin associated protein n=1 Tax=Haemaphysalis longicornis TaxID=44386 RepID=A0A9J6GRT6_HAELO|nr:hypothetical protein HPB48_004270 [Haemaphysalis longicornis]
MSSSNTQRAGKSSRDRGNKSPSATTQSLKSVTATDGHAKPPDGFIPKVQPTPEQIRLAQIINDPTKQDDPDIQNKVHQVMEVTGQSSDAVVIALHDCDNDPTRAITMLIEGNKQEGEWETRGKKKKPVKEGSSQQQQSLQKGDQGGGGGGGPGSSNKENRGGPRGEGGPRNTPRGSSGGTGGGGGRGRGGGGSCESLSSPFPSLCWLSASLWKSKEIEKNERNLEDGRPGDRGGDVRPRGGGQPEPRPGRGRVSPQSMDTWSNSTSAAGQRPPRGQQQESMAVGTWNDLAASEDWSEEDWSGQLETKVFTASGFNQQATESIKAAVGVGSSSPASTLTNSGSYPSHSQPVAASPADAPVPSKPAPAPQRTKTPRVRVPPPSKIPESAVEMPEDSAVTSLDVQFGGIEFGTDTFDFGATDGPVPVSTSQPPSMPPGLGHGEQQAAAVPSSTPYLDGHHSVSKGGVSPPGVSGGPLGGSQQAAKDVSPSQQQQQQHQPSAGVPNAASLARPPGIPAPKEVVPGGLVPASAASANALASPASSSSPAAASSSPAGHGKGPSPSSSSGPMGASSDHLLLQAQAVSERSKSVSSSSVAGPQSKMYTSAAAAQRSSSQGALEGKWSGPATSGSGGGLSSSAAGKVEQPMYSSAGGHHYGAGAYQAGGANKSLVGSYLATHSQGFPSSTSAGGQQQQQQHYYPPQQTTSSAAVFSQQQSNGEGCELLKPARRADTHTTVVSYGVSAKLSGSTGGLNPHSVKDSVLDSAASQQGATNQHAYENSHVAATVGGLPSGPVATLATTASSLAGATATTSVLKNSMSATGKTMPTMPPGVPTAMLGHHQFLVGNAPAMPYYGLQQQPLYSYEELQMLQTRMPHLGYYDMQYPLPATSLAGRDLTLNNMAYAAEGKFGRAENSDSSPGTVAGVGGPQGGAAAGAAGGAPGAQQGPSRGAPDGRPAGGHQPFLNTLPPGYGYYFPSNIMPGSIHHYGPPPMFPVPPVTNAHGPTTSAQFQKANAYASHSFTSGGYDSLTPTPDYAKNTYGAGSQGQAKGISGSLGSADASRSGHTRTHPHLAKSFEKPGFLAGSQSPAAAAVVSSAAAVVAAAGHQQQPGTTYPQFAGPRGSPPALGKGPPHMRQAGYPHYWGN